MNWEAIFRDAVPGVAGVAVYDTGATDILGRYCIAKHMRLPNGRFVVTQCNRVQRPAAVRYAKKWIVERAEKAGVPYVPGDGAKTWAFKPVEGQP